MPRLSQSQGLVRVGVWSAFLAIALGIALSVWSQRYTVTELSDGLKNPGIALEVPATASQIYEVIGKPDDRSSAAQSDRQTAAVAQYLDFPFILCYVLLFGSAALIQARTMRAPWMWLGWAAAVLTVVAGFCDVMEDLGILRAIREVSAGHGADAASIAVWGWTKWLLLFVVLLCTAPLLANRSAEDSLAARSAGLRWIGLVFAAWMISAGFGGILARWFQHRLRLVSAASAFAALPLYFWPCYALLRGGALAGLDRLGNHRALRWLTKWPTGPKDAEPADQPPAAR